MDEEPLIQPDEEQSEDIIIDANTLTPWRIRVKLYSICQIVISLMFWIWALVNILRRGGFDLGVISFLFPLFAGIFGYLSTNSSRIKSKTMFNVNIHLGLTIFGHFFVTINYALGAVITYGDDNMRGYFIYCLIFTALWAVSWILISILAYKWRNEFKQYINP